MCLIFIAIHQHPRYPLVVAGNRDEFYDRPTALAGFWEHAPDILAGRDLQGGGTWLGITRTGRFAALTNYRDPASNREGAPSRGRLVSQFLRGHHTPRDYLRALSADGQQYNGFSLVLGDLEQIWYFSNRSSVLQTLPAALYGLSNHLLDTPWPKVERGKRALGRCLAEADPSTDTLLDILADRSCPDDESLPDTGVGLERERLYAPVFIASPTYGTRSSTVILVDRDGKVSFVERVFEPASGKHRTRPFSFTIQCVPSAHAAAG